MERQKIKIASTKLKKKKSEDGPQAYYKSPIIKIVWYQQEQRGKQINGTEQRAPKYSILIFNKGAKEIQQRKNIFLTNGAATSGHLDTNKYLGTDLTSFTEINSKWNKYLTVKHKIIKLLEDNIEENPDYLGLHDGCKYTTKRMIYERKYG